MTAVGKKLWITVAGNSWRIEFSHANWLAAGCRDAPQRTIRVQRKQDHAVDIPRSAAWDRRARQNLSASTINIDTLQFAHGEETDRAAVRRPKRILCALGSR